MALILKHFATPIIRNRFANLVIKKIKQFKIKFFFLVFENSFNYSLMSLITREI